jgi:hypothetical protein
MKQIFVSKIDGEFHGWDGETKLNLINGQVWVQAEYAYTYFYRPNVIIYNSNDGFRMKVEDMNETFCVRRIR